MIREIAELTIKPGSDADFLAAVEQAMPQFKGAPGCQSMKLEKVIETPDSYRLMVLWETLEAHTEDFRNSPAFQEWRALAGPFFASPPNVYHTEVAFDGF